MESRQFCSVCKEWLEMEVVHTNDGDDDDGVVWFRCPQCQGFLPKLKSSADPPAEDAGFDSAAPAPGEEAKSEELTTGSTAESAEDPADREDDADAKKEDVGKDASEPLAEYAALLAEKDPAEALSYRPWDSYEVGQCLHHLAWDDCGVVVAKENLPGGREVIKVYFEEAGVVRLIEKAQR